MKVEFNNEWYRKTCKENGFDPDNVLSSSTIELAKSRAISMKMYLDAQKRYKGDELHSRLQTEIDRLNNERISFMLDALAHAEIVSAQGRSYNEFLKRMTRRR